MCFAVYKFKNNKGDETGNAVNQGVSKIHKFVEVFFLLLQVLAIIAKTNTISKLNLCHSNITP